MFTVVCPIEYPLDHTQGPEHGVRQIFDHARSNAPCILVIEDLDSLVTSEVRSFLLNELDGLVSPLYHNVGHTPDHLEGEQRRNSCHRNDEPSGTYRRRYS